jgi:tagaturonate reductase
MAPLPALSRDLLRDAAFRRNATVDLPDLPLLDLPEKAVQFGTGAFLRGFVDAFLDDANRRGQFSGRVVAVASTASGRERVLNEQNGLYTLSVQGLENGREVQERRVVASVSRALSAADEWDAVLACARNPDLELVFSNTTEVGIALDQDDKPDLDPPRSFPGKLTRFLYERARAVDYDVARGVTVIPCELIEENGERLCAIVLALAARWNLGAAFVDWIEAAVPFCNTLVDRIVPGAPPSGQLAKLEETHGYRDAMLTTCERYRLFAIEGDEAIRERLRFAQDMAGIVIAQDITPYRERKVRVLNGTHTVMVPVALLARCETVLDAMEHRQVRAFIRRAMLDEIVPGLDVPDALGFAHEVLERFSNPYIRHALVDITLQATTKMRVRVLPSIVRYAERTGRPPASLTLGFAAQLLLLRDEPARADDKGEQVRARWRRYGDDEAAVARAVCADLSLWETDLSRVPGFVGLITEYLSMLRRTGISAALDMVSSSERRTGDVGPGLRVVV